MAVILTNVVRLAGRVLSRLSINLQDRLSDGECRGTNSSSSCRNQELSHRSGRDDGCLSAVDVDSDVAHDVSDEIAAKTLSRTIWQHNESASVSSWRLREALDSVEMLSARLDQTTSMTTDYCWSRCRSQCVRPVNKREESAASWDSDRSRHRSNGRDGGRSDVDDISESGGDRCNGNRLLGGTCD